MKLEDVEMRYEFKTHCKKCGMAWMITSTLLYPEPSMFQMQMKLMLKIMGESPRDCCGSKLPEIGKEWTAVWPE